MILLLDDGTQLPMADLEKGLCLEEVSLCPSLDLRVLPVALDQAVGQAMVLDRNESQLLVSVGWQEYHYDRAPALLVVAVAVTVP